MGAATSATPSVVGNRHFGRERIKKNLINKTHFQTFYFSRYCVNNFQPRLTYTHDKHHAGQDVKVAGFERNQVTLLC